MAQAYIYKLVFRRLKKKKVIFQFSDDIQSVPDVVDESTEDNQMYKISEVELLKMVQELPVGYSTVFNLYAIEDFSHREIAGE